MITITQARDAMCAILPPIFRDCCGSPGESTKYQFEAPWIDRLRPGVGPWLAAATGGKPEPEPGPEEQPPGTAVAEGIPPGADAGADCVAATDGRVLAVVRAADLPPYHFEAIARIARLVLSRKTPPSWQDNFLGFEWAEPGKWEGGIVPCPEPPGAQPCRRCKGKGRLDDVDDEIDSDLCLACDARGWVWDSHAMIPVGTVESLTASVPTTFVSAWYARVLHQHKATLRLPMRIKGNGVGKLKVTDIEAAPIRWQAGAVFGLVMPMVVEKKK